MKIFFIAYGGSHVKILLPLIKEALKDRSLQIVVFAPPAAIKNYETLGIRYVSYLNFISILSSSDISQPGVANLINDNHNEDLGISYSESAAYILLNIKSLSLLKGISFLEAFNFIKKEGRQKFHPLFFFQHLLAVIRPDIVVGTNSPKSEVCALEAAIKLGIKSLSIDDLFGNHFSHKPVSNNIFVMSNFAKDNYLDRFGDSYEISVVGNPYFEEFYSNYNTTFKDTLPQNVILFLNQNFFFDSGINGILEINNLDKSTFLNILIESANSLGHIVAIRNHPSLRASERYYSPLVLIFDDYELELAISKSKVIIGFDSTVLLQSLILNKAVVEITFNGKVSPLQLSKKKIARKIDLMSSKNEVKLLLKELISEKFSVGDYSYYIEFINAKKIILSKIKQLINNE